MARFTANFRSDVLGGVAHVEIIFPQASADGVIPTRVLYLLHGMFGGCVDWLEFTRIVQYAYKHNFIVVMPEVGNSFYADMVHGGAFFTYVAHELPRFIEQTLNVTHTRADTYIAGLSMGGYGAVKIALTRPAFYTACASFSGAVDAERIFIELPKTDAFRKKIAKAIVGEELKVPPEGDLFRLSSLLAGKAEKPRMLVTCGTEDALMGLLEGNRRFDAHMQTLDFDYTYREWPGGHDWNYWEECLPVMFEYFG